MNVIFRFSKIQAVALLISLIGATLLYNEASGRDRPNIVLVMTDDQGFGDLGVHGNELIETPNLDRFAGESLEMERFYVNPLCSPTRASLMTGRYYLRTGVLHTSRGAAKMSGDEITIAELLGDAGYRTGIFGKWHLGDNYPMRPQDQGFQETLVHRSGGIGQTPDADANYFEPVLWRNGQRETGNGYCTDLFFDAALEFIGKSDERPFFVYLPTNVPHGPLEVSASYSAAFDAKGIDSNTAKIYGMLKNLDENFGRLTETIEERGLGENTLVIFMTDNGPTRGRFNAELRGNKGSVYEGGIRVPFFARWPGNFEPSKKIDRIAAHIDVLPTLLEVAGAAVPNSRVLDGTSLLSLWTGKVEPTDWPARTLFTQHIKSIIQAPYQNATAFDQKHKIVFYPKTANDSHFSANTNNLEMEVFDIELDFREQNDLSDALETVATNLKRRYDQWFQEMKNTRGFQPGLIHLGTRFENPSLLCRYQDGHRPYGTDSEPIGWPVKILASGRFRIEIDASEVSSGYVLAVRWSGETRRLKLPSGENSVDLELEEDVGIFDVWTEDESGANPSRESDVIVERLR